MFYKCIGFLNYFNIFILKKDSVDEVLDDKIENGICKYLIKWKHFGSEYNKWVSDKKNGLQSTEAKLFKV